MSDIAPAIHSLDPEADVGARIAALVDDKDAGSALGVLVIVHVREDGTTAYARVITHEHRGAKLQRWLEHVRRGSSPGGWSQEHSLKTEKSLGQWKRRNEPALDRLLIGASKRAARLDQDAPYLAVFAAQELEPVGVEAPPA
jgi:hypothetical protein